MEETATFEAPIPWPEARSRFRAGTLSAGELACHFLVHQARRQAGRRWLQGDRRPPIPVRHADPIVRLVARQRLWRVEEAAAEGAVAWAGGRRPARVFFHIPGVETVLALQAEGLRCVSLLDGKSPPRDPLRFACHDLCHLEKFAQHGHYTAQVGFFFLIRKALADPAWRELENRLDRTWIDDRDHVIADMNGSPAFLYLVLMRKLALAAGRLAGVTPGPGPTGEFAAGMARLLGLEESLIPAPGAGNRKQDTGMWKQVVDHFEEIGAAVLDRGKVTCCSEGTGNVMAGGEGTRSA